MPPEITNDQELGLKKRARRRLVGAIALVVLMMIILPIILQDRAAITPKEAITITMPESLDADSVNVTQQAAVVENVPALPEPPIKEGEMPVATEPPPNASSTTPNNQSSSSEPGVKADNLKAEAEIIETKPPAVNVEKNHGVKAEPKKIETKLAETKSVETKPVAPKPIEAKNVPTGKESFTIQVGVYSELANVKQLQAKLKEVGLTSRTEKVTTPKGEKIRLRVGKYASRQEAADALVQFKTSGLSGIVISND